MLVTVADVHAEQWTRTEHLLATVVDLLGEIRHAVLIAPHVATKDVRRMKPPEPIERPGMRRRKRGGTPIAELAAMGVTRYVGEVSDG